MDAQSAPSPHLTIALRMGLVAGLLAAGVVVPLALGGFKNQALVGSGLVVLTVAASSAIHLGRMLGVWLVGVFSLVSVALAAIWVRDTAWMGLLIVGIGVPFECLAELAPACRTLRSAP